MQTKTETRQIQPGQIGHPTQNLGYNIVQLCCSFNFIRSSEYDHSLGYLKEPCFGLNITQINYFSITQKNFLEVCVCVCVCVFLTAIWLFRSQIWAKGPRKPCNQTVSLSLAQRLMEFEPGTFRFQFQRLNPLDLSPQIVNQWDHMQVQIQCIIN